MIQNDRRYFLLPYVHLVVQSAANFGITLRNNSKSVSASGGVCRVTQHGILAAKFIFRLSSSNRLAQLLILLKKKKSTGHTYGRPERSAICCFLEV